MHKYTLDFKVRVAIFVLGLVAIIGIAALGQVRADGGPLPMCPPCPSHLIDGANANCGPHCSLKAQANVLSDGTDPMPLCRPGPGRTCKKGGL